MIKIITVLKSGREYKPEHVYAIQNMCKENIDADYSFVCLSDLDDLECDSIKLEHDWPTWWSKMEVFKIKGPCLFFDLDTLICGNIDEVIENLQQTEMCMLKDQWNKGDMGSGMMYWKNDMSNVYNEFKKNAQHYMSKFRGDQNFINSLFPDKCYIQDYCNGEVVSFKANLNYGRTYDPEKHKIVYFHGPPRPWMQRVVDYIKYLPNQNEQKT